MLKGPNSNNDNNTYTPITCGLSHAICSRLLTLLTIIAATCSAGASMAATTLIKQVTIVTATQQHGPQTLSGPRNVLIEDGRIVAIGAPSMPAPLATTIIEANGLYLSPGLIDSHVHLDGVPGYMASGTSEQEAAMVEAAKVQIPRSYLYHGFTTVLDIASSNTFIQQWNDQPLAPRAYFCGATPIANGYPLVWMEPEQQYDHPMAENLLFEPSHAHTVPKHYHSADHQPQALAKKIHDSGALCIKAFYEEGFGPKQNLPVPAVETIKALTAAAHTHGLKMFLHATSSRAHQFAIDAGVDVLAHGLWHNQDEPANIITAQVVKNGIALQPTLSVVHGELAMFAPGFFEQPSIKAVMPHALIEWYQSDAGQQMKRNLAKQFPADVNATESPAGLYKRVAHAYVDVFKNLKANVHTFVNNGGTLVFGSDTPSGPFYTQFPGYNGWQEIKLWQQAGIPLTQIFSALTVDNAKLLGLEKQLGTVEVGKQADLLLLKQNPLESADAYNQIVWVLLNGEGVKREMLAVGEHTIQAKE